MIVKAGPVRSAHHARLLRRADIVSVRVGDTPESSEDGVGEDTAAGIRSAAAALALCADPVGLDPARVERLAPHYVEFTAADPEKTDLAERQLAAIAELDTPTIATGFALARDDLSLLDRVEHLERLVSAGVRYVQVELESAVDPGFRIGPGARRRFEELTARVPVLVTDAFTNLAQRPRLGEAGVFLDLDGGTGRPRTFALSAAVRLLRG